MVKGLSRGKFAAVKFYSGLLYQGDLQLQVTLFTTVEFRFSRNYFPVKRLKDFQSDWDFRFQKNC